MKIHFIGLSCFLIENRNKFRVLVDPFNDAPEWRLGPRFPKEFNGKPFGANIVLMSEPDADHAYAPGGWLQNAPETKPNSDPFPKFDVKGTIIYEWNGDLNIAWQYIIDGVKLVHLADNAHVLTSQQREELGYPDILFISPPKTKMNQSDSGNIERENIRALRPKIIIWAHHLAPKNLPNSDDSEVLERYFMQYLKNNANTNKGYKDESSFMELCYIFENAIKLNKEYSGIEMHESTIEITPDLLQKGKEKPLSIIFRLMLASSDEE